MKFPARQLSLLPILFQAVYFSLLLCALTSRDWVSIEVDNINFTFSLTTCENCPPDYMLYTPECFLHIDCKLQPSASVCPIAQHLARSRDMFLASALISLTATVLSSLKHCYQVLQYNSGPKAVMTGLLSIQLLSSLLGVVMWFGETNAKFTSSDLIAGSGPQYAISALILCAFSTSTLFFAHKGLKLDATSSTSIGDKKVLGLTHRQWLLVKILPLLVLSVAFDAVSLSLPWVSFRTTTEHTGTLLVLDNLLSFDSVNYSCIAGPACLSTTETTVDARNCKAFSRLLNAGTSFLWCECACLMMMVLWVEAGIYYSRGVEYGVPTLNFLWPIAAVGMKVISIMTWFIIALAGFTVNCEVTATVLDIDFCAKDGPIFAMWHLVCLVTAACFYIAIYRKRRNPILPEPDPDPIQTFESKISFSVDEDMKPHAISPELSLASDTTPYQPPGTSFDRSSGPKNSTADASFLDTVRDIAGVECICCQTAKALEDIRFELPCGHWIHIECFGKIGNNRRNCPKCKPLNN